MGKKPTAPENSGGSEGRPKPPIGRRFQKGQSGNPGGRPKTLAEFKDLTRNHSVEAVNKLVTIMRRGAHAQALKAAELLLDRAWGKPAQRQEIGGLDGGPVAVRAVLTSDEKRTRSRALAEKAAVVVAARIIAGGGNEPTDAD